MSHNVSYVLYKDILFMLPICFPCWRDHKCFHISRLLEIPVAGVLPGVFGKLHISIKKKTFIDDLVCGIAIIF